MFHASHDDSIKSVLSRRIEVITGPVLRRRWTAEEKARIVAESFAGQMSALAVDRVGGALTDPSSHTTGRTDHVPRRFPSCCNASHLETGSMRPSFANHLFGIASLTGGLAARRHQPFPDAAS